VITGDVGIKVEGHRLPVLGPQNLEAYIIALRAQRFAFPDHAKGDAMKPIAILVACSLITFAFIAPSPCASQEPIKIGFLYVFSGRLGHYGAGAKQGAEIAMDEINKAGGVLGRKVVGTFADTQLKPNVGVEAATKLVTEQKVDVVMGIVSSGVADAVAPVLNRLRMPLVITLAMTPDVTGPKCNPYTFRVSMNGPQNLVGAATLAADMKDVSRWTTIGPDYLFGYQCWEYFQKFLREKRSDVTFAPDAEIAYAPVTTTEFKPYIEKIMKTRANGVLISLYGGNLMDFIREASAMGFFDGKRKVLMNLAFSGDVMVGLSTQLPKGLWLGGLYWFLANSTPANEQFVAAYTARYHVFPDFNAHGGYAGVKTYAEAVKKAGTTDKEKVIKELGGLVVDLPQGRTVIRAGDHQAVMDGVWGMTGDFDRKLRCRKLDPLKIFPGEQITPPVDQTGCKMPQ
jgi:branched-chain amino acid transport system substrate-binding protein